MEEVKISELSRTEIIELLGQWYKEGKIRSKNNYANDVMHTKSKSVGTAINKGEVWITPCSRIICKADVKEQMAELFETKRIYDFDSVMAILDKQTTHELKNRCMRGEYTLFDALGSNAKLYVK